MLTIFKRGKILHFGFLKMEWDNEHILAEKNQMHIQFSVSNAKTELFPHFLGSASGG